MTYEIFESNFLTVIKKLDKLNAKLARIGANQIKYSRNGEIQRHDEDEPSKVYTYVILEVEATAPVHNGWHFLATIVHTQEGNIIRSVPGYQVSADYRDKAPVCDHCKQARMRRDTYVVQHDDGRTMQVGSTCMHEFLTTDPTRLTIAARLLFDAFALCESAKDRRLLGGSGAVVPFRIDLDEYLANVAAVVLREGRYVTRAMATVTQKSTASAAYDRMLQVHPYLVDFYPISDAARKLANDARNWVLKTFSPVIGFDDDDIPPAMALKAAVMNTMTGVNRELSDFEHNLLSCARADAIEPRLVGIAAYIIEAFRRANRVKAPVTQLDGEGLTRIMALLTNASKHLSNPKIRLAAQQLHMQLSLAGKASKNAGYIYVKGGPDVYFGKISPEGKFFPVNTCPADVEGQLKAFAAEPEKTAAAYGKMTGCCCFCGRTLTDDRSTDVGFGPVCAERFGLTLQWKAAAKENPVPVELSILAA